MLEDEDELVCSSVVLLPHPAMAEALKIRAARRLARIALEANRSAPVRALAIRPARHLAWRNTCSPPQPPQPRDTAPWLDQLNPEQRAAATHPGGPLLILAGAGTGKTTTLCSRVAWLVNEGVAPERILLLTFTRRAAREMLQRARALAPIPAGSRGVLGGTFHSVAHRFVRMHAASLGLAPGFAVLDAGDAADLLDLIREEHGHAQRQRRFPKKSTLLDIYSRTVNAQRTLSEVVAESFPWCEDHVEDIASLLKAYTARKRALGVIDLDDLLLYWRALAADEVIGPAMEDGFDHVLVDEYQDVNGLQVEILLGLRRRCREVTAVGDDLQAIYGWRSASPQHILEFADHFPEATLVTLERNYRSSQPILDTANVVAAQANRSYRKQLRTTLEQGARPELIFCRDESAQAGEVCERVLEAREQGMELRAQAVLMRASHDSDLLELELTRRQIPFVKYGGLRYLEAAHVKDLIALFRLVDNPANELSWFRVLQLLEGVGPVTARRVLDSLIAGQAGGADGLAGWDRARETSARLGARIRRQPDRSTAHRTRAGRDRRRRRGAARRAGAAGRRALSGRRRPARRSRAVRGGSARGSGPRPLRRRARARPAAIQFGFGGTAPSRRGLPGAVNDPLRQGPRMGGGARACPVRRKLPGLHVGGHQREHRGGAPAAVRRDDPRAPARLYLHVPVRYYHRPRGIDDAHGYGKPSRFLTDEVRRTCELIRSDERIAAARPDHPPRKISVSVDALFR